MKPPLCLHSTGNWTMPIRALRTIVLTLALLAGTCGMALGQVSGFGNGSGWALHSINGTGYNSNTHPAAGTNSLPVLTATTARLLPNAPLSGAASSIFYGTAQPISAFNASFTYQATGGSSIGDGLAFVIQSSAQNALGSQGGNGSTTISQSFATAFVYNSATPGNDFIINGVSPVYAATGSLSLTNNQHPISVTLSYNTLTLYETITDTVTGTTYSTSKNVDINAIVGGQTACIGFTAGSSSSYAAITVSNFTFTPVTVPGIGGIGKPIVPNGWGSCVQPNGWGGDNYQQTGTYGDEYFSPSQQTFFQQSGMTLIRADLVWNNVEFSQGVYNWSYYDGLINNLQGTGVTVMFILDYNNSIYSGNVYQQPALGGFVNYAAAAAAHFAGKKVMFEIWNEPNFGWFTGSQYSTIAIPTEQAMRAANPNVTIIGPAEGEADPVWREAMLGTGGGNLLNAYSFHPYTYPPEYVVNNSYFSTAVTADILTYTPAGQVPMPLMYSESGVISTLPYQASFYTRLFLDAQLYGVPFVTNFKYQDVTTADNNPANNDFGMIYANNTAKPAYTAVKNLISSLNGYEQIGSINTGNYNLFDSVYQKGSSLAEAIWSENSPGGCALPYIHYITTGSAEYTQILNAVDANSQAVIAPPSFPTQITMSAPATQTSGPPLDTPFQITVQALDEYNNPINYNGTFHFTSTDPNAVLPADVQLTNGVAVVKVSLNTSAYEYVTATDTATPSITNAYLGCPKTAYTLASSVNPITVNQGTSLQSTISVILGNNSNTTLSLSGVPVGVSASLSTTSFNADGTCILTLTLSPTATTGTYSIQVNSVGNSAQSTLAIPVTIGAGTTLATGSYLSTGQYLVSQSGVCYLIQQSDGNLVLYAGSGPNNKGSYIWGSQATAGGGNFATAMQTDGNLVTYTGTAPSPGDSVIWNSATYTGSNYTLSVLDTQVIQIQSGSTVIWQEPANATPTYAITDSLSTMTVNQGTSGNNTLNVNYLAGYTGTVTLSAANLPTGVSASFSSSSLTSSGSSIMTLTLSPTVSTGTSSITINAISGSTTRSVNIPLTIGPGSTLANNTFLAAGQYLVSPSGDCYLISQSNGDLVLYKGSGPSHQLSTTPLWSSNGNSSGGNCYTLMQTDGNLVTYAGPGNPIWSSATYTGNSSYTATVLNTEVLQILNGTTPVETFGVPVPVLTKWGAGLLAVVLLLAGGLSLFRKSDLKSERI